MEVHVRENCYSPNEMKQIRGRGAQSSSSVYFLFCFFVFLYAPYQKKTKRRDKIAREYRYKPPGLVIFAFDNVCIKQLPVLCILLVLHPFT